MEWLDSQAERINEKENATMNLNMPNLNLFQNCFKATQELINAHLALNKATNELMGKKFYSNDTKKTWRVINVYEQGNGFKNHYYAIWIEDISTELKFWSWKRFNYGWKHPRMMVPVEVIDEKFREGILVAIENDQEIEGLLKQ